MSLSIQVPESIQRLLDDEALGAYATRISDSFESEQYRQLAALDVDDLFPAGVSNSDMAKCCLSGLWMLHNYLDQSHSISQDIHSAEGSFWHGIMHRRESDYSNAKYWYRSVGSHPVFQAIEQVTGSTWDPYDFVDRCQAEERSGELSQETIDLALIEWKSLFEFCFSNA
jgi:hypothetical protein